MSDAEDGHRRRIDIRGSRAALGRSYPRARLGALVLAIGAQAVRAYRFLRDDDYVFVSVLGLATATAVGFVLVEFVTVTRRHVQVTESEVCWHAGLTRAWSIDRTALRSLILAQGGRSAPRRQAWRLALVDDRGKLVCRVDSRFYDATDRDQLITALDLPVTRQNWPGQFSEITDIPRPVRGTTSMAALTVLAVMIAGVVVALSAAAEFGGSPGTAAAHDSAGNLEPDPAQISSIEAQLEQDPDPSPGRPTCRSLTGSITLSQELHVRTTNVAVPSQVPAVAAHPQALCQATAVAGGANLIVVWHSSLASYASRLDDAGWTNQGFGGYVRGNLFLIVSGYGAYVVIIISH